MFTACAVCCLDMSRGERVTSCHRVPLMAARETETHHPEARAVEPHRTHSKLTSTKRGETLRVRFSASAAREYHMPRERTVTTGQVYDHGRAGSGETFWRVAGVAGLAAVGFWLLSKR